MKPVATYSFLPWLRQGLANTITAADGDATVQTRASTHVTVRVSGDPVGGGAELTQDVSRDIALYGPGDIVGIDSRAVVRTEPREWLTNFESNYLPAIDFYDEDFPWRYTPAAADGTGLRLRPWITLLVLAESEFAEGGSISGRPLPYITINNTNVLPPAADLWAWAHVHVNGPLWGAPGELVLPDMGTVLPRLEAMLAGNSDRAYSRLVCPRRLDDNTGYHALVIPTFETGRLAGLGHDPATAPHATFSAWAPYPGRLEPSSHPVYYRWFFRTGSRGDFEYLVRLLKPEPIDPRVGTRDIDVTAPDPLPAIAKPELNGVLRLGGALRVPDADLSPEELAQRQVYESWDAPYPDAFQNALAAFVNLPDDYAAQTAAGANAGAGAAGVSGAGADPDPLITAPLYGRWHALTQRLLTQRDLSTAPNTDNWVHRLNLDPRFRVAAADGVNVVETNAETYMNDAWQQIGDVLAANQRIRRLHLATRVSASWQDRYMQPLASAAPERALLLTAPVARRVLASPVTVAHLQASSLVPAALTSPAMRRVVRPGGRLVRSLPFGGTVMPGNLLQRVDSGEVTPAPPKVVPPGLPTVDRAVGAVAPPGPAGWLGALLLGAPWLLLVLLALIAAAIVLVLVFAPIVVAVIIAVVLAAAAAAFYQLAQGWKRAAAAAQSIAPADQTPATVDTLPQSPDFTIQPPGSSVRPRIGSSDSPTAVRFKTALRDAYGLMAATRTVSQQPALVPLHIAATARTLVTAIDPRVTIPRRGASIIDVPPWVRDLLGDTFDEVMAYPKIDLPMYEPLKAMSIELFLPNINLIAPNSITLIETNQRFIESYMVGLNHEFARKLLWREYPTDQRGSYFRQFWDVRGYIDSEGLSHDPLKEKLYDIPEIHHWALTSKLGEHNNRAVPGEPPHEDAVLVIRGELLKKYPTAVIYAHRAQWTRRDDGSIDVNQPRSLVEITDAEQDNPPRSKVRSPLYEAKADPDIYFFGFDLSISEAQGGSGEHPTDDPGWFFVIKERPGEPRFGLEISRTGAAEVIDELSWTDAEAGAAAGTFLQAGDLGAVALAPPPAADPEGKKPQHDDDVVVAAAPASAARWAYFLFRPPVMVAVHASEMLRDRP